MIAHQLQILTLGRHGQSHANQNEAIFEGGAPGPVDLTDLGRRQASAMAIAAYSAGKAISSIAASDMPRAQQTKAGFVATYPGPIEDGGTIRDIHEVRHGSLEGEGMPKVHAEGLRTISRLATLGVLVRRGVHPRQAVAYAPWLALGGRGDGEDSFLLAGLRARVALRQAQLPADVLVVGHQGTWRAVTGIRKLTSGQLDDLTEAHIRLTTSYREARANMVDQRVRNEGELSEAQLANALRCIAGPAAKVVRRLGDMAVPAFKEVSNGWSMSNAAMLQMAVTSEGSLAQIRRITPLLPLGDMELTSRTVGVHIEHLQA